MPNARGIGLGVELYAVSTHIFHRLHHLQRGGHVGRGVHEQAHARTPKLFASADEGLQARSILRKGPAMVAGELAFAVGHKGHLMGAHLAHKVHQVVKRVAFNVELAVGPCFEQLVPNRAHRQRGCGAHQGLGAP